MHGGIHLHQAQPAAAPPPPHQLPSVSSAFVSRTADLAILDGLLADLLADTGRGSTAQPLIAVTGPAGVGKTSLVSKWLRGLGSRFPGGHLYADLRGHAPDDPAPPSDVLGTFLRGLGALSVPADPAEQAALWRTYAAGRRLTVTLDNAFTAAQVRALLPGDPGSLVVVTSRRALTGLVLDGARFHRLPPLSSEDSLDLLARGVGRERVAGQRSSAIRIVALCAGLPLAVCLASARLAAHPAQSLAVLADDLADDASRLTALDVEGETTMSHALNASYAMLSADARLLYRRLGTLPVRTFDPYVAAAACDRRLPWARRHLDELRDAHLAEELGPETVRFHDLVRAHARSRADGDDPAGVREEAERRLCDWYLHTATTAQARITAAQYTLPRTYAHPPALPAPFDGDAETDALDWLDERREDLMTVLGCAADRGWHGTAWQLVDACWPLFLRRRHYDLWIHAHRIGLASARRDGNGEAVRQMLNSGAIGLSAAGQVAEAVDWYTQSLDAARDAGDVRDAGQALLGLGACHQQAGDLTRAAAHLRQAVATWQSCGYLRGVALARIVLGEVALAEHRLDQAVSEFGAAHAILLSVDDPHEVARALAFLGSARAQAGEHAAGRGLMESALTAFTASGAVHWQARTLEMLAQCAALQGDRDGSDRFRARAVALYERTSPRDARRLSEGATAPGERDPRNRDPADPDRPGEPTPDDSPGDR